MVEGKEWLLWWLVIMLLVNNSGWWWLTTVTSAETQSRGVTAGEWTVIRTWLLKFLSSRNPHEQHSWYIRAQIVRCFDFANSELQNAFHKSADKGSGFVLAVVNAWLLGIYWHRHRQAYTNGHEVACRLTSKLWLWRFHPDPLAPLLNHDGKNGWQPTLMVNCGQ